MYTKEYMNIGLNAIKQGKTIDEAIKLQKKLVERAFPYSQDNVIDRLINTFINMYEIIDDTDAAMSAVVNLLRNKENSELQAIYSRMSWIYKKTKKTNLNYPELIVEIRDMLYEFLKNNSPTNEYFNLDSYSPPYFSV